MATTERPRRSGPARVRTETDRGTRAPRTDTTVVSWYGSDDGGGDTPRRTMPVAHIWLVALLALVIGALLNAPGIRKTALGQDVGWQRDIATFFADPLFDVSHALYLDRPRTGIQDVIGRSGNDDIDLTLPDPIKNVEPEPPKKRVYSPQHQAALYVTGDSLAITPGESVINKALATQSIGILGVVDGHVATGLARPEIFNWPAYLADVIARDHPDAVVLTIGSNDDQTLTGEGGGESFGTPEWQTEYRRRVGGLMDAVTGDGKATLFWVGLPPMRNTERYETRYTRINEIVRSEAARRKGRVVFVDTTTTVSPPGGGYADYIPTTDGSVVQVRAGDGIHFTREGGDLVADAVLKSMRDTFDLDSWMQTTTTTAPAKRKG
jgi:uncharacterized protein